MRRRGLLGSFASRLLIGALIVVLGVLAAVAVFLLVSRDRATTSMALRTADQRAGVLSQLIARQTAVTGQGVVGSIAAQPALADALAAQDPRAAVSALFPSPATATAPGHHLAILGAAGEPIFDTLPAGVPRPTLSLPSVVSALRSSGPDGVPSVELLGGSGGQVSVDVARRVGSSTSPAGVVVDVAPLGDQLRLFAPVIGPNDDAVVFVPASTPTQLVRLRGGSTDAARTPGSLTSLLQGGATSVDATYDAPLLHGSGSVAAGLVAVRDSLGRVTGYLGVEAPLAQFSGETRSDEVTVSLIALFVILVTALLVLVFVDRYVRRPVARLERGVARIAAGDYAASVPVTSRDELGRLASAVNSMGSTIQANIEEIEGGRRRLDAAIERLGGVSRALTTTGSVAALQAAVVRAAAAMTGARTATMLVREGDRLSPRAGTGPAGEAAIDVWGVEDALLAGRATRVDQPPQGVSSGGLLAVPMFYSERVVGALAVICAPGRRPVGGDEQALAVLANNAAIAMENTLLFERERETVRRLRELDSMKSEFLATVQHELRTPLTAIMGMSDLLELCWESWPDERRFQAIADIQTASRTLYDVVETIIDFTLIDRDQLDLALRPTAVADQLRQAIAELAARLPGGTAPPILVDVVDSLSVAADPERFRQVLRALLDNAVKFSPQGGDILVRAVAAADRVHIDVIDHGIGIAAADTLRIFDRFFQADNSTTRAFGGTGMGLALVRRLVEAHSGRIGVESEPGLGTRFHLEWPAATPGQQPGIGDPPPTVAPPAHSPGAPPAGLPATPARLGVGRRAG